MRSSVFTIMKKELARFFGDRRLMVSILMPGILIYVVYTFMGSAMGDLFSVDEDYVPTIQAAALPDSIAALTQAAGLPTEPCQDIQAAKEEVTAQELDLLLVFSEEFDREVAAYEAGSGQAAPNVEVYYNSASAASQTAYMTVTSLLDAYESGLANKFDVNAGVDCDLATEEDTAGSIFAMLLPMLLMTFLYSGCSSVAPESIAGEKERGTIATMLITPIRRGDIAVGKILALAIVALLSGASSALGTILALPRLMGGAMEGISTNIYSMRDYLLLAVVILSTVLVLVTVISILSAFAKTVKEAQSYATPLMVLVMLLGVSGMFGGGASRNLAVYCIPLYNSVQCMSGVFSFTVMPAAVAVTAGVNGAFTLLGVFVLAKMFNSEKIIFSR